MRPRRVAECAVVAHAAAAGMALVADHERRERDLAREAAAFLERPRDGERRGLVLHRMDVEQQIRGLDDGPQFARAAQLGRRGGAIQPLGRPDAVEILVHVARLAGHLRIEVLVGEDVAEGEGERAACRAEPLAEQPVERDRAADLVAVHERRHQHARPGRAGVEAMHVVDAGAAVAVAGDVRRAEFDRIELRRTVHGAAPPMAAPPIAAPEAAAAMRRRKVSHSASCASATNSSGLCAWSMWPGPQITVGIPAAS